jgi:hypothetical protein
MLMGLAPTAVSFDGAHLFPLTPRVPGKEANSFVPKPAGDFHIEAFHGCLANMRNLALTRSQALSDSV